MKALSYIALLAGLAGLVWLVPILWELAVAGAIGGAYWIFFRQPAPRASDANSRFS